MARRQEEQLEHSTRLAELGEMAASISHELNQPLTGIRNYARNAYYMLEQKPDAEAEVKNNLRLISEQVDRAAKIINQMRELTKRSDATFSLLDRNSVIRESVEFILPQLKLSEVAVSLRLEDCLRLEQVFLNLLSNARQANDGRAGSEARDRKPPRFPGRAPRGRRGEGHGQGLLGGAGGPALSTHLHNAQGRPRPGAFDLPGIRPGPQGIHRRDRLPRAGAIFTMRLPAAARETGPARSDM